MGIQSWVEASKIKIKREDLEKLRIDINEFFFKNIPDFQPLELKELILRFGFGIKFNKNGDLIDIYIDGSYGSFCGEWLIHQVGSFWRSR